MEIEVLEIAADVLGVKIDGVELLPFDGSCSRPCFVGNGYIVKFDECFVDEDIDVSLNWNVELQSTVEAYLYEKIISNEDKKYFVELLAYEYGTKESRGYVVQKFRTDFDGYGRGFDKTTPSCAIAKKYSICDLQMFPDGVIFDFGIWDENVRYSNIGL